MRRSLCLLLCVVVFSGVAAVPGSAGTARRLSAWLPYWDHERGLNAIRAHGDQFREISPFWFRLAADGTVQSYPNAHSAAVIGAIREAGARIVPTISNEFDRTRVAAIIGNPAHRAAHVAALTAAVTGPGYDGLDLDYESLWEADRSAFSTFVAELADALHAESKTLTVAVHAKTSEPGSWDGPRAQDWTAIGRAADRVRIMAYDYHWASSAPGAIAPAWWVDQIAGFAAQTIEASKVEVALPLYGYDWVGSRAADLTFADVRALIDRHRPKLRWSDADKESWFTYREGGKTHTVWFADERSTQARLASITGRGMTAGFWRLGGEDAGVWNATRNAPTSTAAARPAAAAPTVRIDSPAPEATSRTFRYTARGIARAEIYVDGTIRYADETGRGSFSFPAGAIPAGRHRFTVRVLSAAGTAAIATVYARV